MSRAWSIAIDAAKAAGTCRACPCRIGLLATVSLLTLGSGWTAMAASHCASGPPAQLASPSQLFDRLRTASNAQLLTIGLMSRQGADECAWTYEVKMLTASGAVVELEFEAEDLDLVGASGPNNDRDAAALVRSFPGGANLPIASTAKSERTGTATGTTLDHKGDGDEAGDGRGGSGGSSSGSSGGEDGGGDDGGSDDGGGDDGGSDDGGSEDGGGGDNSGSEDGGGEGGEGDTGSEGGEDGGGDD